MRVSYKVVVAFVITLAGCNFVSAADDAAALYKKKCAHCHGAAGEGKPALKATPIKGTTLSSEQIQDFLAKGAPGKRAPHSKAISGLKADQIKALADYCKTL